MSRKNDSQVKPLEDSVAQSKKVLMQDFEQHPAEYMLSLERALIEHLGMKNPARREALARQLILRVLAALLLCFLIQGCSLLTPDYDNPLTPPPYLPATMQGNTNAVPVVK